MPSTRSGDSRRSIVAEAGIRIIANRGLRALTHRAVDAEAGLPLGSTSYHAKTRSALLELIVETLAAHSITDTATIEQAISLDDSSRLAVADLAVILDSLIATLANRRDDMRARYALLLELDDHELRRKLTTDSEVHRLSWRVTTAALHRAGLVTTDETVREVLALADALTFQRVTFDAVVPTRPILEAYLRGLAVRG